MNCKEANQIDLVGYLFLLRYQSQNTYSTTLKTPPPEAFGLI